MPPAKLRVSLWEWAQTTLLVANLAWATLCLGGYLAETNVATASLTAALLATHGLERWFARERMAAAAGFHPAGFWLLPFLVYATANVLWVTPTRWLGWLDWFNWVQLTAVFWVTLNGIRSRHAQWTVLGALALLAVIGVLLSCYQRFVDPDWMMLGRVQAEQYAGRASGSFGIPNSFAALLLLLTPLAGALTFRPRAGAASRVLFGWLTLVFVFGLGLTISRGAWIGLGLALALWPFCAPGASWRRRLALAGLALAAVLATGALAYAASARVRERFEHLARDAGERSRPILWRAALRLAAERPVFGTGAGSFNDLFERHRPEGFIHRPDWAHNDYLNTLSDYGAVGFALLFGGAAVVALGCARRRGSAGPGHPAGTEVRLRRRPGVLDEPLVRQGIGIGLLAFAFQLFVDFHFKLPALAMAFAAVAGILVSRLWRLPAGEIPQARACWAGVAGGVAVVIGCAASVAMAPQYRAEGLRQAARRTLDRVSAQPEVSAALRHELSRARILLDQAVECAPRNAQIWSDRAFAATLWSHFEPALTVELGAQAEADATRALALCALAPEFWVRRGVARDMQDKTFAAADDFTRAISLGPKAVLPWYHYAYHVARRKSGRGMALALADFCLRLDPQNPDALRLRQRLATGQDRP